MLEGGIFIRDLVVISEDVVVALVAAITIEVDMVAVAEAIITEVLEAKVEVIGIIATRNNINVID